MYQVMQKKTANLPILWEIYVVCAKTPYYAALEACLEQEGITLDSEFYLDAEGKQKITARQAKQIRLSEPEISLFHSLYVIEAVPKSKQQQVTN